MKFNTTYFDNVTIVLKDDEYISIFYKNYIEIARGYNLREFIEILCIAVLSGFYKKYNFYNYFYINCIKHSNNSDLTWNRNYYLCVYSIESPLMEINENEIKFYDEYINELLLTLEKTLINYISSKEVGLLEITQNELPVGIDLRQTNELLLKIEKCVVSYFIKKK